MSGTLSPILEFPLVAPNQNQKEVTINDGLVQLEGATQDDLVVPLTSNAATLDAGDFNAFYSFAVTGATAEGTLTVPGTKRTFAVNNTANDFPLIVETTVGTISSSVTVSANEASALRMDGATLYSVGGHTSSTGTTSSGGGSGFVLDYGTTTLTGVGTLTVAGAGAVVTGTGSSTNTTTGITSAGSATLTVSVPGLEITDGTHTVASATELLVVGGDVSTSGSTSTTATLTITGSSGGSLSISDGTTTLSDVTDLLVSGGTLSGTSSAATLTVSGSGSGGVPVDFYGYVPGTLTANQVLLTYGLVRQITFPANFASSLLSSGVAATATTTFTITGNGTVVGHAAFSASGTIGSFSSVSTSTVLSAGTLLSVEGPATPDATIANISLSITGTR